MPVTLFIANKAYSSWSMRPWLLMASMGIPFEEVVIPMARPDSKKKMLKHSPAGKMPALKDGDVIAEVAVECFDAIALLGPADGGAAIDLLHARVCEHVVGRVDIAAALEPFDLRNQLSSNRTQGLPNMIALIRETAARLAG